MATRLNWRTIAAQTIYRAYPDSDLLSIDPPGAGETIGDLVVRAEGAGDTLFLFLCREASDEIDAKEYVDRLYRAGRDIDAVREAFETLSRGSISGPPSTAGSPP